jgi:hypothetical protein
VSQRFVARNSPWRIALLLILNAAIVGLGLWIAGLLGGPPKPGREWIGWACVVLFSFFFVASGRRLLDRSDRIVVDDRGIYWHPLLKTIPWSAIKSCELRSVGHQKFLCLELGDLSEVPRSITFTVASINKHFGFGDVVLSVTGTDQSIEALMAAVRQFAPATLARQITRTGPA